MWKCLNQTSVALSSTEAEFVATSEACKAILWILALMSDLDIQLQSTTPLLQDNQGATVSGSEGFRHAKHVAVRFNFLKDQVDSKTTVLVYRPTAEMTADILTKPLLREKFEKNQQDMMLEYLKGEAKFKRGC